VVLVNDFSLFDLSNVTSHVVRADHCFKIVVCMLPFWANLLEVATPDKLVHLADGTTRPKDSRASSYISKAFVLDALIVV